jgi:hypothetical protein
VSHAFEHSPQRSACRHSVALHLSPKNVSTANARCSTDQRCMMTEGFKPLYPVMCVSLHHLHTCRHGAKFKLTEPLFLKNVSTANARCSSDQRCMITKGFKPFYSVTCISLRYLHRCRHGAKFKYSNGFCPTLYLFISQIYQNILYLLTYNLKRFQ